MSSFRLTKVGNQLSHIISELIMKGDIKDHRVSTMVSVSSVDVSKDLAYARVRISGFVSDSDLNDAVAGLNSAAGFIQSQLGRRLKTRNTPKLTFIVDRGIAEGFEINKRIDALEISPESEDMPEDSTENDESTSPGNISE